MTELEWPVAVADAVFAELRVVQNSDTLLRQAAREVFTILHRAIDSGTPESFLECPRQQDAFRRLVR